ncbi:hypothetical protein EVJ58_g10347 [Rhodofomes roseus]|uniref:Uncharacterized protein n=1 Tax=Rhodofomes roseus TaxID=34475 RepID=A0A4Y9XR28_9APHY|nr:hypothetical protein EVJ58_g10347 [Rhodofomes roseus]
MDTLSVELHAQIFEFAAALPLPVLAVEGLEQIRALTARLAPNPHYLRRVRHLYLADRKTTPDTLRAPHVHPASDADLLHYEETQTAAARLLVLAAPTLETLALAADCPFTGTALIAHLFALELPHLRELAVRGFYPYPAGPYAEEPVMLRLERLYLEGNRNPHGLLTVSGLREACPALEQLVISGVVAAQGFANEAQTVVGYADGSADAGADTDAPLPRGLRIVVRPGTIAKNAGGRMLRYHAKMLETLKRAADSSAGKLVLPRRPYPADSKKSGADPMRELWRERVAGGRGWWE